MARLSPAKWLNAAFLTFLMGFAFAMLALMGVALPANLLLTALWGLFSGLLLVGSEAYMQRLQQRAFSGKKQASASSAARQQRSIEVDLSYEVAWALALAALHMLDGSPVPTAADAQARRFLDGLPNYQVLRLHTADPASGQICAGLSSRILGITDPVEFTRIRLHLERLDAATTRIRIDCQPNAFFMPYDLGRNAHYANTLALYLRRASADQEAPARLRLPDEPLAAAASHGDEADADTTSNLR